jgi:hypothetical protein
MASYALSVQDSFWLINEPDVASAKNAGSRGAPSAPYRKNYYIELLGGLQAVAKPILRSS